MVGLAQHRGGWIITLTFVAALAFTIIPLPDSIEMLRPEWIVMVLIYWCMALPDRIGVGVAWLVGLMLDVVRDVLLGQYALGLAIIAFLILHLHQRIRVFPLWQQGVFVSLLIIIEYMIAFWIKGITGETPGFWFMMLPALTTLFVWPPTYLLMRHIRRRYQVT